MGAMPMPIQSAGAQPSPIAKTLGNNTSTGTVPGAPGVSAAATNPFMAAGQGTSTTAGTSGMVPLAPSNVTNAASNPNATNQDKQLTDILGKGIGGDLNNLLNNLSGVDASALQSYIQSLQPQMAQAQTNVNAQLGAGGVSANSSVAAIADSNLQSQETAAIAGESAQLQTQEESLDAQILTGMQGQAASEVSASGWGVFGDVLGALGKDATGVVGAMAMGGTGLFAGQ